SVRSVLPDGGVTGRRVPDSRRRIGRNLVLRAAGVRRAANVRARGRGPLGVRNDTSLLERGRPRLVRRAFGVDALFGLGLRRRRARRLKAIFLEPPDIVPGTPFFFRPRFTGMSLFLTTPVFVWVFLALREVRRDVVVAATAVAALLALLPDLFHATWGFQQFGYRFSIDAQPFLVALGLTGDGLFRGAWRRRPTVIFILAIVLSLAVNFYATIAISRFEYWQ